MTNFFAKNTSPAYRELVHKGREWHNEYLAKLVGGGAHLSEAPIELTDVVDGVVFDRYTIHITRPLEIEKRRVLDVMSRGLQVTERLVVVDIDQAKYDTRWLATNWTAQQRLLGCVAIGFCFVVILFAMAIERYRITQLRGEPMVEQLIRLLDQAQNQSMAAVFE